MFGKFSYLLYTLLFTLPLLVFLWIYYWEILKKWTKLILILAVGFTAYTTPLWIYALDIKVWAYSSDKILNIHIFGAVLEDIIWWFLIVILQASFILVILKKEDNKESLLKRD